MSDEYYDLDSIRDGEPFVAKDGHRMPMVDVVKDLNYWKRKKEELQAENAGLKKQSEWLSVDDFEKHLSDNDFCFVHFPCGAIKKCYLNDYRYLGGSGVCWQDMGGDDLPMLNTKFIKIKTPAPPEGE